MLPSVDALNPKAQLVNSGSDADAEEIVRLMARTTRSNVSSRTRVAAFYEHALHLPITQSIAMNGDGHSTTDRFAPFIHIEQKSDHFCYSPSDFFEKYFLLMEINRQ